MNVFDEMTQAMDEAALRMRAADDVADRMAKMLIGRLRRVNSGYALANLKRELRDFNMQTRTWSE